MAEEQRTTDSDRMNSLAAELVAIRRALYALVEALVWVGIGATMLAYVLIAHLPGGVIWSNIFDTLHALLSGVVALVVLRLSRRLFYSVFRRPIVHYAVALSFAAVLGAGIEVAQKLTHGDPSVRDFARDVLGALAALACAVTFDRNQAWARADWKRWALRFGAIVVLARVTHPAAHVVYELRQRMAALPRLADFDSAFEQPFVQADFGATLDRIAAPTSFPLAKGHAGRVTFPRGYEYPKLEITAVGDWSKARDLVFDVYSQAAAPVELSVRIDDQEDSRFNTTLTIPPGQSAQYISIEDIGRSSHGEMDLGHMKAVLFFLYRPSETTILTFDSIRLEMP